MCDLFSESQFTGTDVFKPLFFLLFMIGFGLQLIKKDLKQIIENIFPTEMWGQ